MTQRRSRLLLALPIFALVGLAAVGPLRGAAKDLHHDLSRDLQLDRRLDSARDVVQDVVHQGASELAERTDRAPPAPPAPAAQPRAAKRFAPDSRPAAGTDPIPRPRRLPTRSLGEQQVPDFLALQDDAREEREHSGRLPPR